MRSESRPAPPESAADWTVWPLALALLVGLQTVLAVSPEGPFGGGALWGPDEYMRLLRVERLYDTGLWFDGAVPRANAPFGDVLHWTRPLDLLILAGAWPLIPFMGARAALELSGVLVSPALQVAALAALLWAARPLLAAPARFCLGVLFACQPAVLVQFGIGRPDHHGLLLLGFIGLLGCLLRLLVRPEGRAPAVGAGLIAAGALWASVETLAPLAAALAALGLAWIARGGELARRAAELTAVAAAGAALAVAVERPWPWLAVEYDRISVVHPAVLALAAVLLAAASRFGATTVRRRAAALCGAGLLGLGVVAALCPKFLGGPLVEADPWILAQWDPKLLENWPLLGRGSLAFSLAVFLLFLGLAPVGLPWLGRLVLRDRGRRRGWAGIGVLLLLFLPLGLAQQRWAAYAAVLLALPYAELGGRLIGRLATASGPAARAAAAAARGALAVALATAFTLGAGVAYGVGLEQLSEAPEQCPVTAMARHLGSASELQDRPRRILACGFHGPELLYRSRHEAVATPYHRNVDGLRDAHAFFTAPTDAEARAIAQGRGADLVAICPASREEAECFEPGAPFYRRLAEGRAPDWAKPLPVPPALAGKVMLFELTR